MASYVMFFMMWSQFGTSSVSIDFTTQQQCESARAQLSTLIPSSKSGYFQYSVCFPK